MATQAGSKLNLEQAQKQAKDLHKSLSDKDAQAVERFKSAIPQLSGDVFSAKLSLRDAQRVIAHEHGFSSWEVLRVALEGASEMFVKLFRTEIGSLAIVPFASLADNEETTQLAQAITTSVSDMFRSMGVVPVMGAVSDNDQQPREVARRRGVKVVFTGTVRREGGRDRITWRCTSIDGKEVWLEEEYDEPQRDMSDVRDSVSFWVKALAVSSMIKGFSERSQEKSFDELDATEVLTRASTMLISMTTEEVDAPFRRKAVAAFRRAVELNPEHFGAPAALGMALKDCVEKLASDDPAADAAEGLACADRALDMAPDNASNAGVCSNIYRVFGDASLALQLAERDSTPAGADNVYWALIQLGRSAEVVKRAAHPNKVEFLSVAYANAILGRHEDALGLFEGCLGPKLADPYVGKANMLASLDRTKDAKEAWQRARKLNPELTLSVYEKRLGITWRDTEEIIEPLMEGLRKLSFG